MTSNQRITLMSDWWPAACRAQNWRPSDRDLRLRVLTVAVNLCTDPEHRPSLLDLLAAIRSGEQFQRQLATANDLSSTKDMDAVKACLGMLADNLAATGEVGHPELGRARRLRETIRNQLHCLALYMDDRTPLGQGGAYGAACRYLESIIRDKFKLRLQIPEDLTQLTGSTTTARHSPCYKLRTIPSQLDQAVRTLSRAIRTKRQAAGHSVHDMLTRAGLPCTCKGCQSVAISAINDRLLAIESQSVKSVLSDLEPQSAYNCPKCGPVTAVTYQEDINTASDDVTPYYTCDHCGSTVSPLYPAGPATAPATVESSDDEPF